MDDVDPVCGMEVDSATAPARSKLDGEVDSICSVRCKELFEQAPERYVATRSIR
jgi:YHS domain-containing protein